MIQIIKVSPLDTGFRWKYVTGARLLVLVDAEVDDLSIVLPDAGSISGNSFMFKRTDSSAFTVTISTQNSQTIDGAATITLTSQYENYTLESDKSNWFKL